MPLFEWKADDHRNWRRVTISIYPSDCIHGKLARKNSEKIKGQFVAGLPPGLGSLHGRFHSVAEGLLVAPLARPTNEAPKKAPFRFETERFGSRPLPGGP